VHSIWPAREGGSFRAFSFAVSYMPVGGGPEVGELPPARVRVAAEGPA
jgi:hypothetical protein